MRAFLRLAHPCPRRCTLSVNVDLQGRDRVEQSRAARHCAAIKIGIGSFEWLSGSSRINDLSQTANPGVRSSNLFGRTSVENPFRILLSCARVLVGAAGVRALKNSVGEKVS